jgi:hypothetical protein
MHKLPLAVVLFGAVALVVAACSSSSDSSNGSTTNVDAGTSDAPSAMDDGASSNTDAPVTVAPETWTWVPVADAHCRDGSGTGFAYNLKPGATKLMIYLEGGGACFNSTTCMGNPSKFGTTEFATFASGEGSVGVFNRADAKNAVKDWGMVYVPYCTGDVHGGANPGGTPQGSTPQQFVGYGNVTADVAQVMPLFPGLTQVLLTGVSAGGFGAAINYDQVATAFGSVPVTLVDDSGPPFSNQYLASCLMQQWAALWGFDKTVLAACGADCAGDGGGIDDGNFAIDMLLHLSKKYPDRVLGLMDSTADSTISEFFGFGASNCTSFAPLLQGPFTAGLLDVRAQLASDKNFGSFYFAGSEHTSLVTALDTRTAGGVDGGAPVALSDWLTQMVAGTATNAGP